MINLLLMLVFIINGFYWRRYPLFLNSTIRNETNEKHLFEIDDLYHVLEEENVFIDASAEELMHIYNVARDSAKIRHKKRVSQLIK
ncbi:MAG: hypothetical protein ABJE79_07565 [Marinomonas sp.]